MSSEAPDGGRDETVTCPDCGGDLVESSSERGDYFCPDCTQPVRSRDAVFYCVDCGEEEVATPRRSCSECRETDERSLQIGGSGDVTWGPDSPDTLEEFAARDCPECNTPLIPPNFILHPLHDGEGNYYIGINCPHCGGVLYRARSAGGEEPPEHVKEQAERDPDPPADPSELKEVAL